MAPCNTFFLFFYIFFPFFHISFFKNKKDILRLGEENIIKENETSFPKEKKKLKQNKKPTKKAKKNISPNNNGLYICRKI